MEKNGLNRIVMQDGTSSHVIEQKYFKTQKILVLFFDFLTTALEVPVNITLSFYNRY